MKGDERILHLHASVSGPDLAAFAGHVFEAAVAVTAEFHVRDFGRRLDRAPVEAIGLSLIRAPGSAS
jgi:predicted DNA-binding protein with PD1-like motif